MRLFTVSYFHNTVYLYSKILKSSSNHLVYIYNINDTVECIQFIADIPLVAHCKEDELKMALSMISEMAGMIDTAIYQDPPGGMIPAH